MYNILKHRIFHKGVKQDFINSKTLYGIGVKHSAQQIFQTLAAIKIINKGQHIDIHNFLHLQSRLVFHIRYSMHLCNGQVQELTKSIYINGFSNNKRTSLRPKEPVVQTVRLSPVITIYDRWQ